GVRLFLLLEACQLIAHGDLFICGRPVRVVGDFRQWGGEWAPPPAEPHFGTPGKLHVEEQRRRAAPRRQLPLALLDNFFCLLAVLAADGEGQRAQTLFGDFFSALETVAVVALIHTRERVGDLVERLRLHLDERELDLFL